MSGDPFAPLDGSKKPSLEIVAGAADWIIVSPIPGDTPAPPARHPNLGAPSASWTYRDAAGDLLGFIYRFDHDGEKEFRPLALWRPANGAAPSWRWMAWPEPRPLYGLDRLAARPFAPVILCEGEKSADAASALLPDYVAIASPNGSRAARKADWRPLLGRQIIIWPDADEPGQKYASEAGECLAEADAASVALITPPADVAKGWDAADALEASWPATKAEALVRASRPIATKASGRRKGREEESDDASKKPPKKRGVEAMIDLVENANVLFWHDAGKNAYASFEVKGHVENHRIASKDFGRWIAALAHTQRLTPPSTGTLGDALRVFEAKAINEGPLRVPFKRVGELDGRWYIDPGYDDWSIVDISPEGWALLPRHDLPMIRSAAMRPMPPLPRSGDMAASIEVLRPFVNADDTHYKLVLAWLIGALWPRGPYPILAIAGEQGTAKSSLTKLLRQIVDPNVAPLRGMPRDEMDLLVSATHSHVLALDNLSRISPEASDILCGIATGTGLSARAKFTDADEFVLSTKNPVILNGIPTLTGRPDLASRALSVQLQPISDEARKSEQEHGEEWAQAAPEVFAALLDVMSCAIGNLPATRLARSGRLADFERLIEAASPALGWAPGEFSAIYRANQDQLDAMSIEADDVAAAIVSLIEDDAPHKWNGTASQLLDALARKVSDAVRRSKGWPQNATALGNRLVRLSPVLRRRGIIIERRHSGERRISIVQAKTGAAPPK